ncbi:multiple sugar transport system substrate-binding protein [Nonomuraea thailandensis]|uniref:Multiple sugar transport system substrate-binding protein n=1 Tax=Nonomuraea thailandensis TaxID=1188745 RepID=A0A9X2G8Q7_9ACTN|nr:sugar ABC transporter substrate-binding protein [Nonomuraea thailandensis]MCP2353105.1 multiple sugar transport system substrate-binding protein [Nonomuraea thailandensis]
MKRKHVAGVAGLVLAATVLAGCGSGEAGGGEGKPAAGPERIVFWGWAKGTKEVVDAFNKAHTDIQVTFEEIPSGNAGGYAKFSNAIKAGNAPDLMSVEYPQVPDFVTQGALEDITAQAADVKPRYPASVFQLVELGGKTWSLPLDAAPQVFIYRKDLFAKHNIEAPKTWDDFRAAAQQVKKADEGARIGSFFPDDPNLLATFAWQAGGKWFGSDGDAWKITIDDEPTKKVAAYWQDLIKNDLVKVQPTFSQEWISSIAKDEVWGYLGANWSAGMIKSNNAPQSGKWTVAPAPNWGTPASGMFGGTTYAVSKGSKHIEAAVKVAKWFTGAPEAWQARLGSGTSSAFPAQAELVPVASTSFDTAFYGGQDIYQVFRDSYDTIQSGWAWGPSMVQVLTSFKDRLGQVSGGTTTVPDVLTQVQADTVAEVKGRGLAVAP